MCRQRRLWLTGRSVDLRATGKLEAEQQLKSEEAHWAHLVIHGVLHLLGHDHQIPPEAKQMEALEIDLLDHLGFPNPYDPERPGGLQRERRPQAGIRRTILAGPTDAFSSGEPQNKTDLEGVSLSLKSTRSSMRTRKIMEGALLVTDAVATL